MSEVKKRARQDYKRLTDTIITQKVKHGVFYTDGTRVEPPYKLADVDRLFLLVTKAGTKRWGWAYRLHDKDEILQLGRYPDVSITQARELQTAAAKLVAQGERPESKKEKQATASTEKATTFGGIVREWIDFKKVRWTPYYLQQVENFMGRYIIDAPLGHKPIKKVESDEILDLVDKIAKGLIKTKDASGKTIERKSGSPSVAVLVFQWSCVIFRYAKNKKRIGTNPMLGVEISDAVTRPAVKNNRALSPIELEALFKSLNAYRGARTTKILIELLALTFVRTGELRQAQWGEFDLAARRWMIPAARMKKKNRGDHFVPLCPQAIALLKELRSITGVPLSGPDWLFRNQRRPETCATATTVNRALENMGFNGPATIEFSGHGFRGTASTLLHENDFEPHVIEAQLAHAQKSLVASAYNKASYVPQRISMMNVWGTLIDMAKDGTLSKYMQDKANELVNGIQEESATSLVV
jgi:integrase